jgi:hypothetical protein
LRVSKRWPVVNQQRVERGGRGGEGEVVPPFLDRQAFVLSRLVARHTVQPSKNLIG